MDKATQSEIIAGGRALLNHPEISELLHINHTDWEATKLARTIARHVLEAAKQTEKVNGPQPDSASVSGSV